MSFKLIYQENANKDPLVRKLQNPAAKYIELLEKIQTNNQVIYGSGNAVAELIATLSDRDYEITKIKNLFNVNWKNADKLFRDYWMMAIDLVNIVSAEVDNMTALGRVRNALEAEYGMSNTNTILLKKQIFDDQRYKTIATNVMDAQHRFKKTNDQRVKVVNDLLTTLTSLLTLERALVDAAKKSNSLNTYDMTFNQHHLGRVVDNLNGHIELFEDLIDKLDEYHGRLDSFEDKIHDIESEFRRANGSDPNFYNAVAPATTYEELYYIGRNAQKSLDIEIANIKKEIAEMEAKDQRLKQKDHLILLNHPKTLGLSSTKKTAEDLMKRNIKDTTLLVTEISDCMKEEGDDVDYCVNHLRAVKDIDLKKLQGHIDYIRHQQIATGNLAKYAKLMFSLHSQRRKLIEKEDLMLMDKHKVEENKKLANLIATRASMDAKIKESLSKRNVVENLYAKSLSNEGNTTDKQLNKVMERIIHNNNDVSNVLMELNKQQSELNNINNGLSNLHVVSAQDKTNIRDSLDKALNDDVKIGTADTDISLPLSTYKDAYFDISQNGTAAWNDVFADQNSTDPDKVGAVKTFTAADIQGYNGKFTGNKPPTTTDTRKDHFGIPNYPTAISQGDATYVKQSGGADLKRYLREQLNERGHTYGGAKDYYGGKKHKLSKKVLKSHGVQTGGASLSHTVAKNNSLTEYTKVLDELIAEKRNKMLSKLTLNPSQSIKVERFKIDLVLHMRREQILNDWLSKNDIVFAHNLDTIKKNIETEYILNALFADIGAYQRQKALIKKISDEFDHQNSVVMKVFAVVIRLVAPDSAEAQKLHSAEREFQAKVRTMTMHGEKINVLCHPSKINLVEVVKNINESGKTLSGSAAGDYTTGNKMNAVGHAKTCQVAISGFHNLVKDLIIETSNFLKVMNLISTRAIAIERGQMYDSADITTGASMNWAYNQVAQGKADVLAEIRAFINQYAKGAYSAHQYVRNNLMTTSDYYEDTQIASKAEYIKNELKGSSKLRKDLESEYKKLTNTNEEIKKIIKAEESYTKNEQTVAERVLILDMHLKKRAHQLQIINNILLNIDNLLNQHRMISQQNAESKIKELHSQQVLDGTWKSLAVLQYDIEEKLTRMDAIRIAYNKVASNNDVNDKFRKFTGELNEQVGGLLNLWITVKINLGNTFKFGNNTNDLLGASVVPPPPPEAEETEGTEEPPQAPSQAGGNNNPSDDRIEVAYNLQCRDYTNVNKKTTNAKNQQKAIESVINNSVSANNQTERLAMGNTFDFNDEDGYTPTEKLELSKYLANISAPLDARGDHKDTLRLKAEIDADTTTYDGVDGLDMKNFNTKTKALLKRQYPLDKLIVFLYEVIVAVQQVCARNADTNAEETVGKVGSKDTSLMQNRKRYPLATTNIRRIEMAVQNLANHIRNYNDANMNVSYYKQHDDRRTTLTNTISTVLTSLFKDTGVNAPAMPDLTENPTSENITALETTVDTLAQTSRTTRDTFTKAIKTLTDQKYCKFAGFDETTDNYKSQSVNNRVAQLQSQFTDINEKLTDAKYLTGKLEVINNLVHVNDSLCNLASQAQRLCEPRILQGIRRQLLVDERNAKIAALKGANAPSKANAAAGQQSIVPPTLDQQPLDPIAGVGVDANASGQPAASAAAGVGLDADASGQPTASAAAAAPVPATTTNESSSVQGITLDKELYKDGGLTDDEKEIFERYANMNDEDLQTIPEIEVPIFKHIIENILKKVKPNKKFTIGQENKKENMKRDAERQKIKTLINRLDTIGN